MQCNRLRSLQFFMISLMLSILMIVAIAIPSASALDCPQTTSTCDDRLAQPVVIFEDDFDQEPLELSATRLTQWTVTQDNIDVIGRSGSEVSYDMYPGNCAYLDLSGSPGLGQISTQDTFTLAPGTYLLSFTLGGTQDNTYSVQLGDLYEETFSVAVGSLNTIERQIEIDETTSAALTFTNEGPNVYGGPVLLKVSLTQITDPTLCVSDRESSVSGFEAEYFNNREVAGPPVLDRVDETIDFRWGNGSPDPSINADDFSARWIGIITPDFSETYTFTTRSDDGIRVWIDDQQVIDNWSIHPPREDQGRLDLVAGQKYQVWVEYYEAGGGATMELYWSSSSQARELVPAVVESDCAPCTPEGMLVTEQAAVFAEEPDLPECVTSDCNCSDFATQEDAQFVLDYFGDDRFRLDADKDGVACASLPRTS